MTVARTLVLASALANLVLLHALSPAEAGSKTVRLVPGDDYPLALSYLVAEGPERPVLLFDPRDRDAVDLFETGAQTSFTCATGPDVAPALGEMIEAKAGKTCESDPDWLSLARRLWKEPAAAVAAATDDYEWLLRAAAFAGAARIAFLPIDRSAPLDPAALADWGIETLYATPGSAAAGSLDGAAFETVSIASPDDLAAALLRQAPEPSPRLLVVANPRDRLGVFSPSSLSLLAPLVSAIHRAPLVLVQSRAPERVERQVLAFIERHALAPTHIILVGDELALRSHRVPDPVLAAGGPEAIGGGTEVRAEIFSEIQRERPQDFAVGRIVAEDSSRASVHLARRLVATPGGKRPLVVLSNADEMFALGETISRATVNEIRNRQVPVRPYFRGEVTPAVIQEALKGTDFLVWEGHARDLTLEEQGGISASRAPRLVFLQGCYTLDRSDPFILMENGTQAIVATSAAIYSASGSAFAKAFFDALLYEDADLGTAVRDARNYLLALTKLKRLRGHRDWTKTLRAALAFSLWGDPTLTAGLAGRKPGVPPVEWSAPNHEMLLTIPGGRLAEVTSGRYSSRPVPRAMLGGLLISEKGDDTRQPKQMFFTVQQVRAEVTACAPNVAWDVISQYAPRTRTLSVLARPEWNLMPEAREQGTFAFPLRADPTACAAAELVGPPPPAP